MHITTVTMPQSNTHKKLRRFTAVSKLLAAVQSFTYFPVHRYMRRRIHVSYEEEDAVQSFKYFPVHR
jgi:hypothetical protein